jgi:hypothetical protein
MELKLSLHATSWSSEFQIPIPSLMFASVPSRIFDKTSESSPLIKESVCLPLDEATSLATLLFLATFFVSEFFMPGPTFLALFCTSHYFIAGITRGY